MICDSCIYLYSLQLQSKSRLNITVVIDNYRNHYINNIKPAKIIYRRVYYSVLVLNMYSVSAIK